LGDDARSRRKDARGRVRRRDHSAEAFLAAVSMPDGMAIPPDTTGRDPGIHNVKEPGDPSAAA